MLRIIAFIAIAIVSAAAGYCLGFRQAFNLGVMADAPVRGSIAVAQLSSLGEGQLNDVRTQLESEVDSGLVWWAQLEEFPLHRSLNALSGQSVVPDNLRYVRRVASYRKAHASPLADPKLIDQLIESARAHDPNLANELAEGAKKNEAALTHMIQKYAE